MTHSCELHVPLWILANNPATLLTINYKNLHGFMAHIIFDHDNILCHYKCVRFAVFPQSHNMECPDATQLGNSNQNITEEESSASHDIQSSDGTSYKLDGSTDLKLGGPVMCFSSDVDPSNAILQFGLPASPEGTSASDCDKNNTSTLTDNSVNVFDGRSTTGSLCAASKDCTSAEIICKDLNSKENLGKKLCYSSQLELKTSEKLSLTSSTHASPDATKVEKRPSFPILQRTVADKCHTPADHNSLRNVDDDGSGLIWNNKYRHETIHPCIIDDDTEDEIQLPLSLQMNDLPARKALKQLLSQKDFGPRLENNADHSSALVHVRPREKAPIKLTSLSRFGDSDQSISQPKIRCNLENARKKTVISAEKYEPIRTSDETFCDATSSEFHSSAAQNRQNLSPSLKCDNLSSSMSERSIKLNSKFKVQINRPLYLEAMKSNGSSLPAPSKKCTSGIKESSSSSMKFFNGPSSSQRITQSLKFEKSKVYTTDSFTNSGDKEYTRANPSTSAVVSASSSSNVIVTSNIDTSSSSAKIVNGGMKKCKVLVPSKKPGGPPYKVVEINIPARSIIRLKKPSIMNLSPKTVNPINLSEAKQTDFLSNIENAPKNKEIAASVQKFHQKKISVNCENLPLATSKDGTSQLQSYQSDLNSSKRKSLAQCNSAFLKEMLTDFVKQEKFKKIKLSPDNRSSVIPTHLNGHKPQCSKSNVVEQESSAHHKIRIGPSSSEISTTPTVGCSVSSPLDTTFSPNNSKKSTSSFIVGRYKFPASCGRASDTAYKSLQLEQITMLGASPENNNKNSLCFQDNGSNDRGLPLMELAVQLPGNDAIIPCSKAQSASPMELYSSTVSSTYSQNCAGATNASDIVAIAAATANIASATDNIAAATANIAAATDNISPISRSNVGVLGCNTSLFAKIHQANKRKRKLGADEGTGKQSTREDSIPQPVAIPHATSDVLSMSEDEEIDVDKFEDSDSADIRNRLLVSKSGTKKKIPNVITSHTNKRIKINHSDERFDAIINNINREISKATEDLVKKKKSKPAGPVRINNGFSIRQLGESYSIIIIIKFDNYSEVERADVEFIAQL